MNRSAEPMYAAPANRHMRVQQYRSYQSPSTISVTWKRRIAALLLLFITLLTGCSETDQSGSGSVPSSSQQQTPAERDAASAVYVPAVNDGKEKSTSSSENDKDPKDKGKEPVIRIGFAMDTLVEERWKKDRDLFRQAAERRGAEVIIRSADGEDARQIAQAEALISDGVDVLVIIPHNAEATATIIQKAHKAGIKVLSYDRLVKNAEVDLYVSFDNEEVGRLQASALISQVPRGKYVYIGGADTDNNAHLFKKGVFDVLQPLIDRGEIQIVYDQWSKDWIPAYARENMRAALKANQKQVDAVIVANDGTAGGAIQALAEQGLAGKIPVAGQDADLAAVQRIVQGTQTMTVYKPIRQLADTTADLAIRLAKGEKITTNQQVNNGKIEVPSVLLEPIAVDRSNLEQTVIADQFHTRQEIYGSKQD
ncbi:D-xylose ABC transporter substrate-binding protein [Paenibacillus wulumuqiensis]|uniref:D-xylose ABC transporter substrate-binding protein n=1 Tax=Paenibacillus wulumuqiensis TaxID=1567107 RepID=UPI000B20FBB3|nr:D-xylose ABC transporter substrate-binding protein [Paenibacillus wulumuqiensis]